MRTRPRGVAAAFLLALVATPALSAQRTGTIVGTAIDSATGQPRPLVSARLEGASRGALSDSAGNFVLARVPEGKRTVQLRAIGFVRVDTTVTVVADDTTRLRVALSYSRLITPMTPVDVVASSVDRELFVTKPNIGTISVTARAMEGMPRLGEPDVIRVLQLLPGVGSRNDFTTGFNVRGGESSQNLILLDGLPIYNPFHLGGLFSTFVDASLGDVTFVSGGFPSRFGGRLSSVLDARSIDDRRDGLHGAAELSVIASTLQLSGGIAGGRGSWMIAGRRTYADKLSDLISDDPLPYHFHDLQARLAYDLPRGFRFSTTAFDGRDVLDLDMAESGDSATTGASAGTLDFSWGNRAAGVTLSRLFEGRAGARLRRDSLVVAQSAALTSFSTALNGGDGSYVNDNDMWDRLFSGSITSYGARTDLSLGYQLTSHAVDYQKSSPSTGIVINDLSQRSTSVAVFGEDLWRVGSRLILQAGARYETVTGTDWSALSPRLSAKYFLTPSFAINGAYGRFAQWMHSLTREDTPIRFFDYWQMADSATTVSMATHSVVGAERWFGLARYLRVEGFHKRYDDLLEYDPSEDRTVNGDEFAPMTGTSYGADLMLRQLESPGSRWSGWLSYSYGLSTRTLDGRRYFPAHDRRHDVDLTSTWRLGKYTLGSRVAFGSGTPYTPMRAEFVKRVFDPTTNTWGGGNVRGTTEWIGAARNSARYPATQRFDLSLTRVFRKRGVEYSPYVSVVNAYNAKNVFLYTYNFAVAPPERQIFSQLPFLPTTGMGVRF